MIKLTGINKIYRTNEIETVALENVNLEVNKGEFLSIMGPSGCGKSTLLNIMGLLDAPTSGTIEIAGTKVDGMKDKELAAFRNRKLGFVFQSFHLINSLNVLDNVELPLLYRKVSAKERRRLAEEVLQKVGLSHRMRHMPTQLSGGQCQRVAIARAIVGNPEIILADEPTGNLDSKMGAEVMELFRLYLVVGGMPAAVSKYIESNNLQEVMTVQQDIIRLYKRDIARYDPDNKLYIEEIFNLIPPELNAKNKRFILKRLNEHAKFDRVESSFLWLTNAGVALPVYNVEEPKVPLLLNRSRNLFKLFQSDVGLLASQYAGGIQLRIINGDKDINFGSVYENAVAQELAAHGIATYYYNNKKRGELDFVIELGGKVLPIEVKSGKDYETHRALSNIMDCGQYDLSEAVVFNNANLRVAGKIVYAPVYMAMFLEKDDTAPTFYKVDLTGL